MCDLSQASRQGMGVDSFPGTVVANSILRCDQNGMVLIANGGKTLVTVPYAGLSTACHSFGAPRIAECMEFCAAYNQRHTLLASCLGLHRCSDSVAEFRAVDLSQLPHDQFHPNAVLQPKVVHLPVIVCTADCATLNPLQALSEPTCVLVRPATIERQQPIQDDDYRWINQATLSASVRAGDWDTERFLALQVSSFSARGLSAVLYDEFLREALASFVRATFRYVRKSGEILDLRPALNAFLAPAFCEERRDFYVVDGVYGSNATPISQAARSIEAMYRGTEVRNAEVAFAIDVINFHRFLNGLARLARVNDRLEFGARVDWSGPFDLQQAFRSRVGVTPNSSTVDPCGLRTQVQGCSE